MTGAAPAPMAAAGTGRRRRRFVVRGVVQGVGFRPFVYAAASALALTGSVANDSGGVIVEVEGVPAAIAAFARRLRDRPAAAGCGRIRRRRRCRPRGGTGFRIGDTSRRPGARTLASPDVATCADCLRELADPADRRYRHPFITCTNCGPRFTIITGLPYDRPATTMAGFPMCAACAARVRRPGRPPLPRPADRLPGLRPAAASSSAPGRPTRTASAALAAGPRRCSRRARSSRSRGSAATTWPATPRTRHAVAGAAAPQAARRQAVRGDGRATSRPPGALVRLDAAEAACSTGRAGPIVLLRGAARRRRGGSPPSVAPGNPDLGVMLPYTPLHHLLLGLPGDPHRPAVLVMTSGNLGGEPIVTDDDDALRGSRRSPTGGCAHDRPIHVPCDDSVVRVVDGEELPIRRSRGYAPLPVALPFDGRRRRWPSAPT